MQEKISRAFLEISRGSLNKPNVDIITAYAAALTLYGNAQRSGIITNLTVAEFGMQQDEKEG